MVGGKIYKEIKLTCEKMLYGGLGLARTKQGVVFVDGLMPGETGECFQTSNAGGVPVFAVGGVSEKSPERREVFCKYFGACGGCDWQYMNYETQVKCKKEIFESTLKRIGKIYNFPEPQTFLADEKDYRIRAKFSIDEKAEKMGFLARGTHKVVEVRHCPLLTRNLNELLKLEAPKIRDLAAIDTENGLVTSLDETVFGKISVGEYVFEVNGNSFFQANRFLTRTLAQWCAEQVENCENLFDLYGGVGLFSVFCHQKAKNVTLVEIDKKMAAAAQKTFEDNSVFNAKAIGISADDFFEQNFGAIPDCVIVDPPRIGLKRRTLEKIAQAKVKTVIYVSCNPTTLARDLGLFTNLGYKIEKTAFFDFYPNTFHIESAVVLEKIS